MNIEELITKIINRKKNKELHIVQPNNVVYDQPLVLIDNDVHDPLAPLKNEPNFAIVQKDGKSYKFCKRIHCMSFRASEEYNDIICKLESNKCIELQPDLSGITYDRQSRNYVVEIYWRNKV